MVFKTHSKIKNKIWFTIFALATVMWAVLIFRMSSHPADESDKMSLYVGRKVATIFIPSYNEMTYEVQTMIAEKLDYPVRKAAHMTEYAVFAVLLSLDIYQYKNMKIKERKLEPEVLNRGNCITAVIISAAYACTDEFHQLFVPGRAGLFTDVLIDTSGALIGVLITYFVIKGLKGVIEKNEGRNI
jgi:VanZ family protein